jgi:hypothetical protein
MNGVNHPLPEGNFMVNPFKKTALVGQEKEIPKSELPLDPPANIQRLADQLHNSLRDIFLKDFSQELVEGLYNITWGYPASDGGHHSGPFGLIEHSLGVAIKMLATRSDYFEVPAGIKRQYWEQKTQLYQVICGLDHDLGKTMEWTIDSGGFSFCQLTASLRGKEYVLGEKRPGLNYRASTVYSVSLMPRLLAAAQKFLNSQYFDPEELQMVLEAVYFHHDPTPRDNPYWLSLRAADNEDGDEDGYSQLRELVAEAGPDTEDEQREPELFKNETPAPHQVVKMVEAIATPAPPPVESPEPKSEAEKTAKTVKDDFSEKERQVIVREAIDALRSLIRERLVSYNNSHFLSENGWLLIVAPKYIADKFDARTPTLINELQSRFGRIYDQGKLIKVLMGAGIALKIDKDQENWKYAAKLKVKLANGVTDLSFLVCDAKRVFSPEEQKQIPKIEIVDLEKLTHGSSEMLPGLHFAELTYIHGRVSEEIERTAMKMLKAYDAERDVSSIADDDKAYGARVDYFRGIFLHEHVVSLLGELLADSDLYPSLLLASLGHDLSKLTRNASSLKMAGGDHAKASAIILEKLLPKTIENRAEIIEAVAKHHIKDDASTNMIHKRLREAHKLARANEMGKGI